MKTGTKACMSSKICRIRPQSVELAALEGQKLYGELGLPTLSNMNISETSRPIAIKLYQKRHCGGELPAFNLGF